MAARVRVNWRREIGFGKWLAWRDRRDKDHSRTQRGSPSTIQIGRRPRWTIHGLGTMRPVIARHLFANMNQKKMKHIVGLMFSVEGGLLASETLLLAKSG